MPIASQAVAPERQATPATYRRLLRAPGFLALIASALATRTAVQMWSVATILFALQRYHSPSVAGLSVFLLIFPGLLLSPLNGALLDRYGRRRLMRVDFTVAAVCLAAIAALAATHALPVWLLLVLLAIGSLTSTLSVAGARSLFPLTVPRDLWDRANAADSLCYGFAQILGPALAGWFTAAWGSEVAFGAAAGGFVLASLALRGVTEPKVERAWSGKLARDVWRGVRYVVGNATLRWLAVGLSIGNVALGIVIVLLPVLVLRLHGNAATVGGLLALEGVVGIPAALLAGRMRTEGREREIMALFTAIFAAATLAFLVQSLAVLALAMAVIGIVEGPLNISVFSLRQRRTHPAWFGRAFAISISLNFAGMPLGSAIGGSLITASVTLAIICAVVLAGVSALLLLTKVPAADR
jgi:MFS family permease